MDRRERLNQIIRMVQESPRSSLDIKARFPRVSARTIERDIEQLALEGRIRPDGQGRSRNPRWEAREALPAIEVKWMSGRAATAIKAMQGCVSLLLPEAFGNDLQPLFLKADHALRQAHNREYAEALQGNTPTHIGDGPLPPDTIQHLMGLKLAIQHRQMVTLRFCRDLDQEETLLADVQPLGLLMEASSISLLATHHAQAAPLKINLRAIRELTVTDTRLSLATAPAPMPLA